MPDTDVPKSSPRAHALPWYSPRSGVFRIVVPALLIAAFAGWIYSSMSNAPRESDRVTHPAGYSIIKPRGWVARVQVKPNETVRDSIVLVPEKWLSLEPSIWVKRYLWPPAVQKLLDSGYVEGDFQGRHAWLSRQKPKRAIDQSVIFQEGDGWYQVGVHLPGLEGARIDEWWQFPLTFHAAPASQSATAPATEPSEQSEPAATRHS